MNTLYENKRIISVDVRNVSKSFPIPAGDGDKKPDIFPNLLEIMKSISKSTETRKLKALEDVSFTLYKGEAVGIIGANGAGKTTLLQIIAGILQPDSGYVSKSDDLTAMLQIGAGFNDQYTGRENAVLACSLLGLSSSQIAERMPQIESFADIGKFFDLPMKTYSSGMLLRLGFSVNTAVDPSVLIVDEALAVGDAKFQSKCYHRLKSLISKGTTLLFVSHDISMVRSLCDRAIWINEGKIEFVGDANGACDEYQKQLLSIEDSDKTKNKQGIIGTKWENSYGSKHVEIETVEVSNSDGGRAKSFNYGAKMNVTIDVIANQSVCSDFLIGCLIRELNGKDILAFNNFDNVQKLQLNANERQSFTLELPILLAKNDYSCLVAIFGFKNGRAVTNNVYDVDNASFWHVIPEAFFFKVNRNYPIPLNGPVHFPLKISSFK